MAQVTSDSVSDLAWLMGRTELGTGYERSNDGDDRRQGENPHEGKVRLPVIVRRGGGASVRLGVAHPRGTREPQLTIVGQRRIASIWSRWRRAPVIGIGASPSVGVRFVEGVAGLSRGVGISMRLRFHGAIVARHPESAYCGGRDVAMRFSHNQRSTLQTARIVATLAHDTPIQEGGIDFNVHMQKPHGLHEIGAVAEPRGKATLHVCPPTHPITPCHHVIYFLHVARISRTTSLNQVGVVLKDLTRAPR